jgi:hypothetical protein
MLRSTMNESFDTETLRLLDETKEVRIETRRDGDSPEHRTIIWVVVVEGEVFVRSVRGQRGRWYREISSHPEGALHVEDDRIPVRSTPVTDGSTVDAVSAAFRSKIEPSEEERSGALNPSHACHRSAPATGAPPPGASSESCVPIRTSWCSSSGSSCSGRRRRLEGLG